MHPDSILIAGAHSTTTKNGAQFSTAPLLADTRFSTKLFAAYEAMWRVQFKFFREELDITQVR